MRGEPDGKYARAAPFRSGEAAYLAGKSRCREARSGKLSGKIPQRSARRLRVAVPGRHRTGRRRRGGGGRLFPRRAGAVSRRPHAGRLPLRTGPALEKQKQADEAERLYLAVAGKPGSPLADAAQFHLGALQYGQP